jgi:hypothetical protein
MQRLLQVARAVLLIPGWGGSAGVPIADTDARSGVRCSL